MKELSIKQFNQIIKIENELYEINTYVSDFPEFQLMICLGILRKYKRMNIDAKINYKNEHFSSIFNFSYISQFMTKYRLPF